MAKMINQKEKLLTKLKELVKEADELIQEAEKENAPYLTNVQFWDQHIPKCQGWVTSATATVKTIASYSRKSGAVLYGEHTEKIAKETERNGLMGAVRDVAQILQRLIGDIENKVIDLDSR